MSETQTQPAPKKLLSELITDAARPQDTPAIPLDTPNWKLNQIVTRVNFAINVKVASLLAAATVLNDIEQLRNLMDNVLSDVRTLTAESSAAMAVMRSKSRTGYTARVTPVTAPSGDVPDVPVRKIDEFGENLENAAASA